MDGKFETMNRLRIKYIFIKCLSNDNLLLYSVL